jgi:Uri superfamily endonuclease
VLVVQLPQAIAILLGGRPPAVLDARRYLYCGSAKGPGGLRARIARHMRHGEALRWHIDRLTEAGHVPGVRTVVGDHECDLVAALAPLPAPIKGFGSSAATGAGAICCAGRKISV